MSYSLLNAKLSLISRLYSLLTSIRDGIVKLINQKTTYFITEKTKLLVDISNYIVVDDKKRELRISNNFIGQQLCICAKKHIDFAEDCPIDFTSEER